MIIDAQIHLWTPDRPDRPWPPGRYPESQRIEPMSAEEALAEMKGTGVDRAVLVAPSFEGDRNDFVLEAAQRHPEKFRVMGRFPIEHPDAEDLILTWKDIPCMAGIRITFLHAHELEWLRDPASQWFWAAAEKLDIPLMVFPPNNLSDAITIAKRYPRLRMIVDHMAVQSSLRDQDAIAQLGRVLELAQCPNVSVKMSAVACMSTEPYPYVNLHAPLQRVFNAFGRHRCFWGTDLTRIKYWSRDAAGQLQSNYPQLISLFTEELRFMSSEDLEWVMGKGLAQTLAWD